MLTGRRHPLTDDRPANRTALTSGRVVGYLVANTLGLGAAYLSLISASTFWGALLAGSVAFYDIRVALYWRRMRQGQNGLNGSTPRLIPMAFLLALTLVWSYQNFA